MSRQTKASESETHALRIDARREKIIDLLERDGQVRVAQLAELLNTTTVTIRSDLDAMEQYGLVERVSGGAVPTTMRLYNREFMRRKRMNTDAKRAIAVAAADEIQDGDTPETLQRRVMEQAEWILLPRALEKVAGEREKEKAQ